MKLDYRYVWLLLFSALLMQGCMGFKPSNTAERIGYIQERLDTGLTGIESSYDRGLIPKATAISAIKNYWQPAKDLERSLVEDFEANGATDEDKLARGERRVKLLVAFLVSKGVLEQGE